MRLSVSKSKNSESFYAIESIYIDGKRSTRVAKKFGTASEIKDKYGVNDPYAWAKKQIRKLNEQQKEEKQEVLVKYSPSKRIPKNDQRSFNGGYLFLQKIYYELGLQNICKEISSKYKFEYDLNSILSRLIYARILFPSSKLATYEISKKFIEKPKFKLHQIYRALEIISKEIDFIQAELYKNSLKYSKRNTDILYYDCTNYYFEIEQEYGDKRFGKSKDNKPNPIVQMGLFMDGNGVPLAFNINKGNLNEQLTLKPLEKKIISDFKLSKFVVCTDAGLASKSNRKFNDTKKRAFITTQSIKKLKSYLKKWALSPTGWKIPGSNKIYDISNLDKLYQEANDEDKKKMLSRIFYKERWVKEKDFEQRLIVTYSIKYKNYKRKIRNLQIERAQKLIDTNPKSIGKKRQNDFKRFIHKTACTDDGEIANNKIYRIDTSVIEKEETFDGFYGVCTNLEDDVSEIIKVNRRRWQIEECFRIMKSEFKARPVYLRLDDRIKAHFTTCFTSLIIYRLLEKELKDKYTCSEIVKYLREMNFLESKNKGYIPTYTRNDFTDDLHETFGFRTDYEIVNIAKMKKILKETK